MSRPQVIVRPVDDHHQQALVDLFVEGRVEAGGSSEAALRIASAGGLASVLRRPEVTAFVAFVDRTPVGYLVLTDSLAGPFADSPCTAIDQLYVSAAWRRHGVARQLVGAAASHADRVGAESIVSNVPSQVRDANRFFARLGFSPTVVRRVTTPAALHRKLAAATGGSVRTGRTGLEEVLQRRRSARFRAVRQGATAHTADA
ncbi:MAG: GNAT family N-acetyltransferase [Lapillicoccus sp.]